MKIDRRQLFKHIGLAGLLLLVAGYLRYSIQETMGPLNKGLLIAGGAMVVAGVVLNWTSIRAYFRRRSARLGANTAAITGGFVVILGLLNFVGYRHHKRVDLTTEKLYSLSDQTRKIASGLQKDVRIIKFDKRDDTELRDLVKEYRDASHRITYERVDPEVSPELAKQYNVTTRGEAVVVSGDRSEHLQGQTEQELTNAILKVTRDKLKSICFVEGHNEKQLTSPAAEGYQTVDRLMKNENYQTRTVNLVTSNQVPSDCDVLVEAGPKQALFPQEAEMVGKYLDGGGKVMFLIDPDTDPGLADLLKKWDTGLGDDIVVDVSGVGRLFGTGPAVPLVRDYGSHPVTKDLSNGMTFFPLARSVSTAGGSSDVSTTELLKTSEDSWAETDMNELKTGRVKFDEGKDKKGPVNLGVAASKKVGEKEARLVVIGDSDFATNNFVRLQSNGDLFMNAISWLAQDEDLISIRPKDQTNRSVTMTASQQSTFFWLTLLFMPGVVLASGIYMWWKRR